MPSNSKNIAELLNGDTTIGTTDIANDAITAEKIADAVALGGPSLGTLSIIRTNAAIINENITINTNGMTAGPITIADNKTVTIGNSGNWSIV